MAIGREEVLEALGGSDRPWLTAKALLHAAGRGRSDQARLRAVLRQLMKEGRIERRKGRYRLRSEDQPIEGVFTPTGNRGGQVADASGRIWAVADSRDAEGGDRVVVRPLDGNRGELIHVLGGRRRQWIGILGRETHGGFVTPYRDDVEWGIRVAASDLGAAKDGDVVVVELVPRRGKSRQPTGRIVEVLGPPGHPEADFRAVVWRRRLPVEFPQAALAEAASADPTLDRDEIARRVDLRDREFLTIDPARARDHDDAVCVEAGPGNRTRLWVAIADVSHYVPEGSALDAEALRRGNSVYFPDRAIPMLPERLSGELCSLRPAEDRFVLCAELEFDAAAQVARRSFYPAVIRSRARLCYEDAAEVMAGRPGSPAIDASLASALRRLAALTEALTSRRREAGSIDFDLPAVEVQLGDDGQPLAIVREARTVAHRAIEEAMLAANRAVAEALEGAKIPALYRIHEPPAPEDLKRLEELLGGLGLLERRRAQGELGPAELARALQRASGRPMERLVNLVALRSMRQAQYSRDNLGHYALAFDAYTHFTSPIRRYADLVVHRTLKDLLAGDTAAKRRIEARRAHLEGIAARVSWRERVAMESEREMLDLKKCAFMAPRVGEEFDGTITGVAPHGCYVTLDAFFVEGLVHVSTLPGYAVFDEKSLALVIRGSQERFRLGDRVRVLVDHVDRVKAWINFSLAGEVARRAARASERRLRRRPRSRAGRR